LGEMNFGFRGLNLAHLINQSNRPVLLLRERLFGVKLER
jgi:hypothetical protein